MKLLLPMLMLAMVGCTKPTCEELLPKLVEEYKISKMVPVGQSNLEDGGIIVGWFKEATSEIFSILLIQKENLEAMNARPESVLLKGGQCTANEKTWEFEVRSVIFSPLQPQKEPL